MKKKTDETKNEFLINASFKNKEGKMTNVKDIIGKDSCWYLNKASSWILTHNAIKTIANTAGISKNYKVEESQNIIPDYKNELEHIVRVTIECNAKTKEGKCIHSDEDKLTITGEANRINTPNKGRGYLRKMAEKRAFDIAVLEHLNLYSSVFSEEESAEFEQKSRREPEIMPGTKEFEEIVNEVNAVLNASTISELKKVSRKIKAGIKIVKYSEKQIKYLRELYQKEYGRKNSEF